MKYDEAESLINAIESDQPGQRSVTVDMKKAFDSLIIINEYDKKKAEAAIMIAENIAAVAKQRAPEPEAQQETQYVGMAVPKPKAPISEEIAVSSKKELDFISNEIKTKFGGMHRRKKTHVAEPVQEISTERLVLPNLSLQDQLSELGKISNGLDRHTFSKEQREIITKEVEGLAYLAGRSKPAGKGDKRLAELRDKRLKEIINKLRVKK